MQRVGFTFRIKPEMKAEYKKAHDETPGRVAGKSESALLVETGQGVLEIRELQIPGKKRLPAGAFLRGFAMGRGTLLGS